MADLRSDTVTHPTEAMYEALRAAPLGDDVFGDDPTVNALEEEAAALLGKEAAIFTPTGTMANSIAIAVSTRPGDEMILMEDSHIYLYEAGGSARLWGVHARPLPAASGVLTPEAVRAAIRADDPHHPRTRLVCLENTHNMQGGRVVPTEAIEAVAEVCRSEGLHLHLDGARLFHAAVALGVPPAEVARPVDTVSACFSKGLSCPAGSILAGSASAITEARRVRKVLGGGMRQVGILAAPARVALQRGIDRLREDHLRCSRLAEGLHPLAGATLNPDPPQSNILFVRFEGLDGAGHESLVEKLGERGVRALTAGHRGIRLVTHRQIADGDVERTIEAFQALRAE